MANEVMLLFNGKTLLVLENGQSFEAINAISGRPGYTTPNYQSIKSIGPIPEGTYTLGPVQYASNYDAIVGGANLPFSSTIGWKFGGWPVGGPIAWGWQRIELIPDSSNLTFGRSGFTIHGGWAPGSAGCIDLNERMPGFAEIMEKYGPGAKLIVDYDWQPPQHCFPASTPIQTSLTSTTPISDLRVGDIVLSFDPLADHGRGALVPRRVTKLFSNITTEWVKLSWTEAGEPRELVATPGHHFLDQHGNFPPLHQMIRDGAATVVLGSVDNHFNHKSTDTSATNAM